MKVELKSYERSTHDLGYLWRSSMSAGTLVPFMSEVALPGDTFDIELDASTLTKPTIGPLFGSWKLQLDVFQVPLRFYNQFMQNNTTGVGMKMNTLKLPQIRLEIPENEEKWININPSSLLSYFNIKGTGVASQDGGTYRDFNASAILGYWDIYKTYYANLQEEKGYVIFNNRVKPTGA